MLLIRHSGTAATATGRFPADEPAACPLPPPGRLLGSRGQLLRSPAQRCQVPGGRIDVALGPWDLGAWTGQHPADLPPDDLAAWQHDPGYDAHGGESAAHLAARVASWLHDFADHIDDVAHRAAGADRPGTRTVAITHGAWIRAAVVTALAAPPTAFWSIDITPGSLTELHVQHHRWRLTGTNWPQHD